VFEIHDFGEASMTPHPLASLALLASATTLALSLTTPASAQLIPRKDLSYSMALAIATIAFDKAGEKRVADSFVERV
jgi:hypothetical protein